MESKYTISHVWFGSKTGISKLSFLADEDFFDIFFATELKWGYFQILLQT